MSLHYKSGEEICAGDVVIWLNQSSEFYQFDQAIMKVWEVAKTNDGEVVGVNLMPPQAESPMQMLRALVRPDDPEPVRPVRVRGPVRGRGGNGTARRRARPDR